ncbi:aminotransferase class IV family protein [Candidatus Uhrbacteria bacterium]|nr:aminotransferase class IV family protein [Candidatus Uhrbacteria bacterium]
MSKGVFETMRTYGGNVYMLDAHLQRLERSAILIGMKLPESMTTMRQRVVEGVRSRHGDYSLKIRVIATAENVAVEITLLEITPNISQGVSATFVNLEREPPQEAKQWPYTQCQQAHQRAVDRGFFDALLVDRSGIVREGAYSNIFWVNHGRIYTTGEHILQGITRQVVCEQVPVVLGQITAKKLLQCDEVFITKTTTGVTGLVAIDGKTIGKGKVGPVTAKLMEYLHALE